MDFTKFYRRLNRGAGLVGIAQSPGEQQHDSSVVWESFRGEPVMLDGQIGVAGTLQMLRDLEPRFEVVRVLDQPLAKLPQGVVAVACIARVLHLASHILSNGVGRVLGNAGDISASRARRQQRTRKDRGGDLTLHISQVQVDHRRRSSRHRTYRLVVPVRNAHADTSPFSTSSSHGES